MSKQPTFDKAFTEFCGLPHVNKDLWMQWNIGDLVWAAQCEIDLYEADNGSTEATAAEIRRIRRFVSKYEPHSGVERKSGPGITCAV